MDYILYIRVVEILVLAAVAAAVGEAGVAGEVAVVAVDSHTRNCCIVRFLYMFRNYRYYNSGKHVDYNNNCYRLQSRLQGDSNRTTVIALVSFGCMCRTYHLQSCRACCSRSNQRHQGMCHLEDTVYN